jgi:parallel beta-helix repeat protein
MNRKIRTRTILILLPLVLTIVIPSGIATEDSLLTSSHQISDAGIQHPAAYYNDIPYQNIQDAINHATHNGTIIIPPGIYTEILTIDKPLTIRGEDPETTLLTPCSAENSYGIKISAEDVILANLTIQNTALGPYATGIKIMKAHATITYCIIRDTPVGIALWSSATTITHCMFSNCNDEGIALLGSNATSCTTNHITGCVFSDNGDGIELQWSSENVIADCRFLGNTHAGIDMIASANAKNTVNDCSFSGNQGFGLYAMEASQLQVTDCSFSSDCVMLVKTKGSVISSSEITGLQLLRNTTVIIDRCDAIDPSHITTQSSRYLLLSPESHHDSSLSPLRGIVSTMTSRLQLLRLLAIHLIQLRM